MFLTVLITAIVTAFITFLITTTLTINREAKEAPTHKEAPRNVRIDARTLNVIEYKDERIIDPRNFYNMDIKTLTRITLQDFKKALPDECFNVKVERNIEGRRPDIYSIKINTFIAHE